ncbi:Protein kinase superfamily protein [Abeliophyllum distichum]|uniref:Protein kinase superfamily protein n=1 Tax=Abeliophyllum distichum TaxID=126358 RepID=A0ABD1TH01_9LAMI
MLTGGYLAVSSDNNPNWITAPPSIRSSLLYCTGAREEWSLTCKYFGDWSISDLFTRMHFFMRKFRIRRNFFQKSEKKKKEEHYWKNGGALLTDLITTFGPRYKIPIRHFSAEEIISATNGFREMVGTGDSDGRMYSGFLEGRPILVKKREGDDWIIEKLIRDVTINSQMNHHKNVLKLLGCCLEFEHPALIYDFCGTDLLSDILHDEYDCRRSLSWTSRLRIASEIASVISYLHNAFPTPIIFRDIKPKNVIIDQHGVAKLFAFSLSISLPPGKLQVEDDVYGTFGYLDPVYFVSNIVTQKTDVYSFGMLLLQLLTGRKILYEIDFPTIFEFLNFCIDDTAELDGLVDPKILGEGGGVEQMEQIQAYLHLALRCVLRDQEDRPFIVDVAKQLRKIERYPHQLPPLGSTWNTICSLIRAPRTWSRSRLQSDSSVSSPTPSV